MNEEILSQGLLPRHAVPKLEELREAGIWLKVIPKAKMIKLGSKLAPLIKDGQTEKDYIMNRTITAFAGIFLLVSVIFASEDIVIEEFEGQDFGEWTVTGEAFGKAPANGKLGRQGRFGGFKGKGIANSSHGGDKPVGTLTSPEFRIERDYISFVIGGGAHKNTAVQLIMDDRVVASCSGQNDENMTPNLLEVRQHKGKTARLRLVDENSGRWGHIQVDHIIQTDTRPEVVIFGPRSREFTVDSKYLVFPINRRKRKAWISLSVNGKTVHRYAAKLTRDPNNVHAWLYLDIERYKGEKATLNVNRATEEGFKLVEQADEVPESDEWYTEPLRPQLRFSQAVGWNNDVNGTVYYDGEWHLFFQHNPAGLWWDNMTWGHAVSKDLVHWEQLPCALLPYTMAKGMCWSGGAHVDRQNSAGFKQGQEDTIVAFVTDSQGGGECLAYSNDRGRTFTWYNDNPVVKHSGRDPKVIWYEYGRTDKPLNGVAKKLGGHWVMAVYDMDVKGAKAYAGKGEKGKNIAFYTSTDLKEWQEQSHLYGYYECSELFKLPVDSEKGKTKWVVFAGDAKYAIGSFDGRTFTPEHKDRLTLYYGPYYGSQLFSNSPDGRQIQIGWLNIDIPNHRFDQLFSLPNGLTLRSTGDGIRMFAEPVKEFEKLRTKTHTVEDKPLEDGSAVELTVSGQLFDIEATFRIGKAKKLGLDIGGHRVPFLVEANQLGQEVVSTAAQGKKKSVATMKPVDGKITIRAIVDRPTMEIYGNNGRVVIARSRAQKGDVKFVKAFAEGGEAELTRLSVHELKSIW